MKRLPEVEYRENAKRIISLKQWKRCGKSSHEKKLDTIFIPSKYRHLGNKMIPQSHA